MNIKIIFSIAWNTFRDFARDRIFYSSLLIAIFLIVFSIFLADLTISETRKILMDFGLAATSISGILIALLTGINSVSKEIQNKTIYLLLSKPISRSQYLIGKLAGGALVCISTHLIISITLLVIIYALNEVPPNGFFTCNYLMLLESILILAISILFSSTTSSSFLAGTLSFGVFVIGRSDRAILFFTEKWDMGWKRELLKSFYYIFPSLGRYDIRNIVAYGKDFPSSIILHGTIYFSLYILFSLTLTSILFKNRDIN